MMDLMTIQPIPAVHVIILSASVFVIGFCGIFLNRRNIIGFFLSLELILLAVNINFIGFASKLGDLTGQIFAMFILTIAAAEIAIGLAILIVYFRNKGDIDVKEINQMQG